jgi:hypothetical protein
METMKRKQFLLTSLVILAVGFASAFAMAQGGGGFGGPPGGGPPGGGRGGGRGGPGGPMGGMYLERTWTAVSFQLECTAEQKDALSPTYAAALKTRDAAVLKAHEEQDMEAVQAAMKACKTTLDAKLKEVLTADQLTALQKLMQPPARPDGPPPPAD